MATYKWPVSVPYYYVISQTFSAIVSTNAGPLSLTYQDAEELANIYDAAYPGAIFWAIRTDTEHARHCATSFIPLPIDHPANAGGLCWSALSKLEWLERLVDNPNMLAWLSAGCRQS